jgi:hypothetical protein
MEEVGTEVMQTQKETKLFQIMAIISLNMGNLNMEVSTQKTDWPHGRKRRKYYKRNQIKKEISRRGINIMWKYGGRTR